ncbi:MAG: rod shape-determining protein MreD [Lachnospiraceae bacterium]|nr:rod shape-determining protein MreD [Lachnospiraceae bacterium]
MLSVLVCIFFVFICFLLQSTVFPHLAFGGIIPNLMIVVTASYGFMRGRKSGLLVGFFSGLIMDIFSSGVLGFYALIYMYIGYLNGVFKKMFFPEDIKLPIALIIGSDFLYNIIIYVLIFLLKGRFQFSYYFLNIIIPEMVYTIIVTCILYPLLLLLENLLERREKEGASKIV